MADTHLYNTTVTWTEGRVGTISEETLPSITVATPPEFPKGVPNIWSPEHLFVAAANVCLMTTFLAIAENSNLRFSSYTSDATGKLEKVDGKFMISEITLSPKIKLVNAADAEKAKKIIEKSEAHCLISNSMKTTILLQPEIS